jgi:hypothetical protein
MQEKLAIIGSHPNARAFDFARTDCDIWVFNEALAIEWVKRADAVFQLHRPEIWRNPRNRNDPNHAAWLMSGETPTIYMQEHYPDVPRCERYPIEQVAALLLPNFEKPYLTSSAAYALALGILKGYKTIEIWGVEMETDTEYRYQRDGVTLWMGVAIGRGIRVEYHGRMFDAPLYGYEGEADIKIDDFHARLAEILPHVQSATDTYTAAKQALDAALTHYHDSGKDAEAIAPLLKAQIAAGYNYGLVDGARQENERYIGKAKTMTEAAGAFLFSRQEFEQSAQRLMKDTTTEQQKASVYGGQAEVYFNEAAQTKNIIKRRKILQTKFAPALAAYTRASIMTGLITGAHRENLEYMGKLDALIRAAGGAKSEAVLLGKE